MISHHVFCLPADCLTPLTRLVLVNGIYFKGLWQAKFDPSHTSKAPFHISDTESIQVDMMHKEDKMFPYGILESVDAKAVVLPYKVHIFISLFIGPLGHCRLCVHERVEKEAKVMQSSKCVFFIAKRENENTTTCCVYRQTGTHNCKTRG